MLILYTSTPLECWNTIYPKLHWFRMNEVKNIYANISSNLRLALLYKTTMFILQRWQRVSSLLKLIDDYNNAILKTEIITFATLLIFYVESLSWTAVFQTIVYNFLSTAMPWRSIYYIKMTFTTSMCRGIIFPLYKIAMWSTAMTYAYHYFLKIKYVSFIVGTEQ